MPTKINAVLDKHDVDHKRVLGFASEILTKPHILRAVVEHTLDMEMESIKSDFGANFRQAPTFKEEF